MVTNQLAAPSFMLRTVTEAGALDQFLPDFQSLTLSPLFSDAGAVAFKYPANGVNSDLLFDDVEIAVTMNGVEIGTLRSIIEQSEGNDADEAEDGSIWGYTCRTNLALLERGRVYPKTWPATNPPTYDFVGGTPGTILIDLISASQGRGALSGLTWDFTATKDSAGVDWINDLDINFDAGKTLLEVAGNLYDAGVVEFRVDKRKLQAYNPDTLGTDKSTGTTPLRFVSGRDVKESPRRAQTRGLVTTVLVAGDNNVYTERSSDGPTMSLWGRREGYYSQSGIDVVGQLDVVGDAYLQTVNREIVEVTHSLYFDTEENPRPITNFDVGDWGLSDVGRGNEKYRIKQWTVEVDNSGSVTGSVTLNDLIGEKIDRLNQAIKNLANGTTSPGASEETDDGKAPAKPTSISTSSAFYLQNGQPRATVVVDWAPVTENADGTTLSDLDGYRARWKYDTDTAWRGTVVLDSDETVAFFDNVIPDMLVNAQVAAFDKYGHDSGWQDAPDVTTEIDTTPPPKPSAPIVASNVGTLRVVWDGLDDTANPMPVDFVGVEVHIGPDGTFTPDDSNQVDFLTIGPTATTISDGLVYGNEYWIRLVAVDSWGNKSDPSDETSTSHAVLTQVVSTEIGTGEVGLDNVRFSDVGNLIDDGSFEIASARVDRQAQLTGTSLSFDNTDSSNGGWSLKSSPNGAGPTEILTLQGQLPVKPGERIFGAADFKATSDTIGTVNLDIQWFDSAGGQLLSDGTSGTTNYILAGLANTVLDGAWHSRVTNLSRVAPPNAATMTFILYTTGRTTGTVHVDAVETRRQIDTLLVADAAITTAKINDLAVNDAKIASASIGKLTTGTLGADMVLAARIKTANTGARAEMNSGGFGLWDASGNQTFYTNSSNGDIKIKGQLISDFTGRRIEINPTSTFLPEIRFYPSTGANYGFLNAFASGADVFVGLNSGQFTANSTTCGYRLYFTSASTGAFFQTINSSTQAELGGQVSISPTTAGMEVLTSTQRNGYVDVYSDNDASTLGASIGHNGTSDNDDCFWNFYQDGTIDTVGNWNDTFAPYANQALVYGTWDSIPASDGAINSWGTTSNSRWLPNITVRDNAGYGTVISAISATGFTVQHGVQGVNFGSSTVDLGSSGVWDMNWWGWRT